MYTIPQCLAALRSVGFEAVDYADFADKSAFLNEACDPWYDTLKGSYFPTSLEAVSRIPMTPAGRLVTDVVMGALEFVRMVPAGTRKISSLLNHAPDNLVAGGEKNIFTPMFFFLARKPESA